MSNVDPLISRERARMQSLKEQKRHQDRVEQKLAAAGGVFPAHPLFPCEVGQSPPCVEWITVSRYGPEGQVHANRAFRANELTDLSQLADFYGGGSYELWGRMDLDGRPGTLTRKVSYRLEGEPKPMRPEQAAAKKEEPAFPMPTTQAPGAVDPTMLMMAMMKQSAEQADRQMQLMIAMMTNANAQAIEASRSSAQMIAGVLSQRGNEASSLVAATGQLAQTFAKGASEPSAKSGADELLKLVEIVKKVKAADIGKDESIAELLTGVGAMIPGFAAMMQQGLEAKKWEAEQQRLAQAAQVPPAPTSSPKPEGKATVVDKNDWFPPKAPDVT